MLKFIRIKVGIKFNQFIDKWGPLSLSELNPLIFNMGLTYLGLEASKITQAFTVTLTCKTVIFTSQNIFHQILL